MRVEPIPDPPGVDALPWYGTGQAIPAPRFVPGLYPHPARSPEGRGIGPPDAEVHPPWTPEQWPTLQAYLRGVDLFNRWYFWEAHEAWEPLWRAHPADSEPARFVQGLIGAAAALLKLHMREARAAKRLSHAVRERLDSFRGVFMGLEVERFVSEFARYLAPLGTATVPVLGPDTPRIRLV